MTNLSETNIVAQSVGNILPLIVSSSEVVATLGDTHLSRLVKVEDINSLGTARALLGHRPWSEYLVGFARHAFT